MLVQYYIEDQADIPHLLGRIHGREYISTVIEIGRFPPYLNFSEHIEEPFIIEIPFSRPL